MDESFGKKYKLCNKKIIASIFEDGKHLKVYPFILRYKPTALNSDAPFQIVISVPKRNFKKAVDRNRIKRQVREAARKNKHLIESEFSNQKQQFALFLMYTAHKGEPYHLINHKIEMLFKRLVESINN